MTITVSKKTRLFELEELFPDMKGQFISGGDHFSGENAYMTLEELHAKNSTWGLDDMLAGLKRLEAGYDVIKLPQHGAIVSLSALKCTNKPFALLLAGGAYGAVCTLAEALPAAARLNELGVDCFCLNYGTATPESFENGLLPGPIEDTAQAVKLLTDLHGTDYFIMGFSAGGHASALWGTEGLGAKAYSLPQPKAEILVYPLITMEAFQDSPIKQYMCAGMFGRGYTLDDIRDYDVSRRVTADYPPTYLVRASDDPVVPSENGDMMAKALRENSVRCIMREGNTGGHGFGLGSETALAGWVDEALCFAEEL